MNSGRLIGVAAVASVLLVGCGQRSVIIRGPKFDSSLNASYVILPFADAISRKPSRHRPQYENAAIVVQDAFETAFLEQGFKTVHYMEPKQEATEKHGVEGGRRAGADVVVFGTVTQFCGGSFLGQDTTVGFSVKAVDVKTGEIVWKASVTRSPRWEHDCPPEAYAQEVARQLVRDLVRKQ